MLTQFYTNRPFHGGYLFTEWGFRVGLSSWILELDFRIGPANWTCELDFRVGLSSWIFELDFRVGFSSWIFEFEFVYNELDRNNINGTRKYLQFGTREYSRVNVLNSIYKRK